MEKKTETTARVVFLLQVARVPPAAAAAASLWSP